jgi:hypothetical protein
LEIKTTFEQLNMMTEERSSVVETMSELNRMVLDPPRFGWTAVGGVADVLPPHEVCCIKLMFSLQFDLMMILQYLTLLPVYLCYYIKESST